MQIIKKFTDSVHYHTCVFDCPATKRIIKFAYLGADGPEQEKFYLSLPRMRFYSIWVGEQHWWLKRLFVNFIGDDNLLYPAILPNVDTHGEVCLGDMSGRQYIRNASDFEIINRIYTSFVSSSFSPNGQNGQLLWHFLNHVKNKQCDNTDGEFCQAIIKFLESWQKNGLDFQNESFTYFIIERQKRLYANLNGMCDIQCDIHRNYMKLGYTGGPVEGG